MKDLKDIFINLFLADFVLLIILWCLTGCSNGVIKSANSDQQQEVAAPLTIDNSGIIPAFDDATSSVLIYLHNNTNREINNISYSWDSNLAESDNWFSKLNPLSDDSLSHVPAHGTIAIPLYIAKLAGKSPQGAASLKINYTCNGQQYSFNHLLNYKLVNTESEGVFISSGAVSSSFGNATAGYTTLYIYGSGEPDNRYKITSFDMDPVLGNLTQGNLVGSELLSRQVATVELNTALIPNDTTGNLSIKAAPAATSDSDVSLRSRVFSSSNQNILVKGYSLSGNSIIVLPSLTPFYDTSVGGTQKAYFYNAGNSSVSLSSFSGSGGVSAISPDNGCSNLGAGASCSVGYSLSGRSGSGQIKATATAGDGSTASISAPVVWYNSLSNNLPQLAVTSNAVATPLVLSGNNPYNGSFNITVTNPSGISVNQISIGSPQIIGGSATASLDSSVSSCNGKTLATSQSCTFKVNVTSSSFPDIGIINIPVSGSGNISATTASSVKTIGVASYQVQQSAAQLVLSLSTSSLSIYGNNAESQTAILTITNTGKGAAANISSLKVTQIFTTMAGNFYKFQGYTATTNCDGKSLAAGNSCQESIILPSQSYATGGLKQAVITYYASGAATSVATKGLTLTIQPVDSAFTLNNLATSGDDGTGSGKASSAQVKFLAGQNTTKKVTLTYKNQSSSNMTVSGVNFNGGLPSGWSPETSISQDSTTCYNNKQLSSNGTCTITLDNNLYQIGSGGNSSTNLNFAFPTLTVTSATGSQYSFVPGNQRGFADNKYYASNYQAVIVDTDSIANNGRANATVTVTHTATGVSAGGYANGVISEKTQFTTNYVKLPASTDSQCSVNNTSGVVSEICNVKDGYTTSNSFNVAYIDYVNPNGIDPVKGATLNISYTDSLAGTTWAYHNNPASAGGSGINKSSDSINVQAKALLYPKKFIFGAYSQWLYKTPDNVIYTFTSPQSSLFPASGGYTSKATTTITGGFNAIDQYQNKIYAAAGSGKNTIVVCPFDQNTGAVTTSNCQWFESASSKAGANLVDVMISNGYLYALDNKGGVSLCTLKSESGYIIDSCKLTATDAPSVYSSNNNRQQRLMSWNGFIIYSLTYSDMTDPNNNTYYMYCKQEANGTLDKCTTIPLQSNNSTSISTSVLMPGSNGNAYIYSMSWVSNTANKSYGCKLNSDGSTISVSSCTSNPLLSSGYSISTLSWAINASWGGMNGYYGDQYVIYYDPNLQSLIGTITVSNTNDGGIGGGVSWSAGQELYIAPGADNTINKLSYVKTSLCNNSVSRYCLFSTAYSQVLTYQILGDLTTDGGQRMVLDSLSIH